MSKKTEVKYRVILTFDVDVKGDTGVYKEISELLEEKGLEQQLDGKCLPSNIYTGVRGAKVEYEGESLTPGDIEKSGDTIGSAYWNMVNEFFEKKKLKHSIFVATARSATTSIKHK